MLSAGAWGSRDTHLGPISAFFPAENFSRRVLFIDVMNDDLEPPAGSKKSPFRAMEKVTGVPPRLDIALMHVAAGANQRVAAAAAGVSQARLSNFLRTDRGTTRMNFWLGQRIRAIAPQAIAALEKNLGSKNAMASVRSAESILDRSGLEHDGIKVGGDLIVSINIGPKREEAEKVINHE
jgi:hypothetical protein